MWNRVQKNGTEKENRVQHDVIGYDVEDNDVIGYDVNGRKNGDSVN
jgi:hypothetical protein